MRRLEAKRQILRIGSRGRLDEESQVTSLNTRLQPLKSIVAVANPMEEAIDWENHTFSPVVDLPAEYEVLDLTKGFIPDCETPFTIGRYNEERRGLYLTKLFAGGRFIHMGIDIGAPVGTPCKAFTDCEISHLGNNPEEGDYGHVIITKQVLDGVPLWSLYGHLSRSSVDGKRVGERLSSGEVVGYIGNSEENGGWAPHLHFQLSLSAPETHDMRGVVSPEEREESLRLHPDPRLVLGPLY